MNRRRPLARHCPWVLPVLLAAVPACTQLRQGEQQAAVEVNDRQAQGRKGTLTRRQLQRWLYAFTLTYLEELSTALQALEPVDSTIEERRVVQLRKVRTVITAMSIAAGSDPEVGLLDMMVCVSLSRMLVEDYLIPEVYGEQAEPLLKLVQAKEEELWSFASRLLDDKSQDILRDRIQQWHEQHRGQRFAPFVRFGDVVPVAEKDLLQDLKDSFTVLGDIDETTRAIDELRMMGERITIYLDLLPVVFHGQMVLLGLEYLAFPEVKNLLANTDQLTRSFAEFNAVVEALPEQFGEQGQKVSDQMAMRFAEEMRSYTDHLVAQLEGQRQAIIDDLDSQAGPIKDMLVETRQSLVAMQSAAEAIDQGLHSLDSFVGRWDVDDDRSSNAANTSVTETDAAVEQSPPFDVRHYGQAASEIALAAAELNKAIHALEELIESSSWDQRRSEIEGVLEKARSGSQDWLDQAFLLGLALMAVFFGGAILTALLYRLLARRILGSSGASPG